LGCLGGASRRDKERGKTDLPKKELRKKKRTLRRQLTSLEQRETLKENWSGERQITWKSKKVHTSRRKSWKAVDLSAGEDQGGGGIKGKGLRTRE